MCKYFLLLTNRLNDCDLVLNTKMREGVDDTRSDNGQHRYREGRTQKLEEKADWIARGGESSERWSQCQNAENVRYNENEVERIENGRNSNR